MVERRATVWILPAGLLLLAVAGPWVTGTPAAPAVAATAAQLLPPGTRVQECRLATGGLVRGLAIETHDSTLRVRGRDGWRSFDGMRIDGRVRDRRMWLGTDQQGSSLLARTVYGARVSFLVGALATALASFIGTAAGLAAAFAPRAVAEILRLATDGLLALPRLLLLLILGVVLRPLPFGVALAIGLASWMGLQRLVETEARGLRSAAFVEAVRSAGGGRWRLAIRHVLPSVAPIVAVAMALIATEAILLESALAYIGVGRSAASWGRIIADGQRLMPAGWWIAVFPGLLLSVTAWAIHLLGSGAASARSGRREPSM